ncbi:unnamed protein product [Cercospora beticola]|nr:unnamed protein product [Cercospora beticola]
MSTQNTRPETDDRSIAVFRIQKLGTTHSTWQELLISYWGTSDAAALTETSWLTWSWPGIIQMLLGIYSLVSLSDSGLLFINPESICEDISVCSEEHPFHSCFPRSDVQAHPSMMAQSFGLAVLS